jgi:ribosomal protein S17
MFSEDAVIITGKVVSTQPSKDIQVKSYKVEYTKQTKEQYIRNLKKAFARNKWIDVKFSDIGENGEIGGCAGITRSKVDPTNFGVRLRQTWKSQNYSDEGYLFLLWEFPENGKDPIIHVRTWQPEWVGGTRQKPDNDISTLGGFDL